VGEKVAEFAKTELFPKIGEAVEMVKELWPHIEELGKAIAEKLQPPLEAVGKFVAEHKEIWGAAGIVIGTVLVGAFLAWAGAAAAAAISTALALAPVIAIGVALTALVAAIIYVVKNWDELTERYPILGRVSNELKAAWEKLTDFTMQKVVPAVQAVAKWLNDNVVPAMQAVAGFISGTLGPRLLDIAKWIFENVVPKVAALVEAWVKLHVKLAQEIIPPVVKLIGSVGEKVIDAAGVVGRWLGVIGGAFVTVKNTIEPPIKTVIGLIQTLIDWIQKIPSPGDVAGKIGDIGGKVTGGIGKLNPFASGTLSAPAGWAIVGEEGPELVRMRGGERVYPADQTAEMLGGEQVTQHFHIGVINARTPEEARLAAGDIGWMAAARSRGFSMGRA
jgi:phage-related protein